MVVEISFPRGGRKPPQDSEKPVKFQKEHDLFGRKTHVEKKKPHTEKKVKEYVEPLGKEIEAVSAELLSYRSLIDGMVFLGCIREVQKMTLGINLPGRLAGRVMVTHISTAYTELLHKIVDDNEPEGYKSLRQIFTLGQCVAVKVINMDGTNEKYRIGLSMMPQDVNSQLYHSYLQVGMLLWGAVSSVEEHGYIIDLGINNCRAFLKKSNTEENKTYVQGEVGWFVVQKCDSTSIATTVALNSMTEKLENMKVINDINLDHLLPGMKVDFTVSKRLNNGLEGKFLNDYTGYIHISHMKGSEKLRNYAIEQTLEARVLYVMPVTKLTYLTFRDIKTHHRGNITDGTLTTCTVTASAKGGLYVHLGKSNNLKGFVSFRRLKSQLPFNGEMDDFALLRRDYPNNSKHKCRVLSYDYLEQVYICSLEKQLTQNIVFSLKDLKVGQDVTATIKEIQPAGLLMQIDNVQCYIKNIHISDLVLDSYANIKSKFKVGQSIKAKVWMVNIKENNCHLTIKPSFLNAETVLTSYEQAKFNQQYLGVVKQISTNGLLIEFFGNVFGWVSTSEMSFEIVDRPDKMFKIGQVVKCTVIKSDLKRLTLSLQPPKITSKKKLINLGQHVDAIVTNIIDSGIEVRVCEPDIPAIIPSLHVSKFPDIARTVAGTYKIGTKLKNLVCLNASNRIPILSMRDTHLYEDNIPDLKKLQINTVLPCSIQSITDKMMLVKAPIMNFNRFVVVPSTNISNIRTVTNNDIKQHQFVLAKILNKTKDQKTQKDIVEATVKLNECWNFDLNESVERVKEYLSQIDRIKSYLKSLKNPLANLNIGEIVTGVVQEKTNSGSYIVDLKNGAKGVVQQNPVKDKISVGSEVKGIVLWIDFVNSFAELSLCTKLITRINNVQDGKINIPIGMEQKNNIHAEVLLVKDDFALVVLRGQAGNRQIVYSPTRLHSNDFFPDSSAFLVGDVIKIAITSKENGKIFGLLKQLVQDTKKSRSKLLTPMIYLPESSKSNEQNNYLERETGQIEVQQTDDNQNKNNKKTKKRKNSESSNDGTTKEESNNQHQNKSKKKRTNSESSLNGETTENNEKDNKSKKKRTNSESSLNEETLENDKTNSKSKKKQKNLESSLNEEGNNKTENKSKKKKNSKSSLNEETPENNETNKKSKNGKISETLNEEETENKKSKKRKNSETSEETVEQTEPKKKKKEKKEKANLIEDAVKKTEETKEIPKIRKLNDPIESANPILSGASNFWNIPSSQNAEEESSGDEDPEKDLITKQQKKKKLTPAERAEAARIEEERIRKIETELADSEAAPKTADQFDRILLANPNNSLMWINYMAFHLEATEIEKARAIARKALNTIEFREEQEKLNVWIAFLNLENRYGSNDSFATLLDEAVQMNDALTVYLQALNILADSKKTTEFTELLVKVSKKFKQNFKMWTGAADACYKCDLKEQARNLMQRALKSLDDKQHVNLLVQFAFMESRYNEPERAEALLEKILASYPRRVDVWTSYVEMLIKSDRIHIARNVLERAAGQKLPARKMKTIFSKYIQFETKYGDEDKVNKVREMAAHYVKTALN